MPAWHTRTLPSPRAAMMPPVCPVLATVEVQLLCHGLGWIWK
jgi:hypothetical protein